MRQIWQVRSSALKSVQYTVIIKKQLNREYEYYWEFSQAQNCFNYFKYSGSAHLSLLSNIPPFKEHCCTFSQVHGSRITPRIICWLFSNSLLAGGFPGHRVALRKTVWSVCPWLFALGGKTYAGLASLDSHWTATSPKTYDLIFTFQPQVLLA